jgi:hypothetical protein
MRRSHIIVFVSFMAILVAPHFSYAALTGLNTAIFPAQCTCTGLAGSGSTYPSAPDFGCVLQVIDNLMSAVVAFSTLIITIFIARAGFMFMTSPNSEEAKVKARNSLVNAVIGILIVLAAYLLIDSILKVIYNSDASFQNGSGQAAELGPWNALLSPSGAQNCLVQQKPPGITTAVGQLANTTANAGGGSTIPNTGSGACSASAVQSAAASGGVTMSNTEAATIACIAGPESTCGSTNKNYNWDGAKSSPPSTAWGPFQITLKGNSACLNNSACEAAAGVTGPLNCNQAFTSGGYSIPGQLLTECQTAAANLSCSAVAANCIVQQNGGSYTAWTGNKDSTAAHQQCVANNAGT